MTTTTNRIERAAKHIRAVKLPSGDWAHYDWGTRRWYTVDDEQLEMLCDYLDDGQRDPVSRWCGATSAKEMPADWEPGE